MAGLSRRDFLTSGAMAAGSLMAGPGLVRSALAAPARAGAGPYGPLQAPNGDGLMLPPGFSSRQVARGLVPVEGTGYSLPVFPDGQSVFRTRDGGWILVTNSESVVPQAGSSAIRFGPDASIRGAYRILGGTNVNCAGGPTPWGTWLSCEELDLGLVWESDPAGVLPAEPRPALGSFKHEAAAVDPIGGRVYLTEDTGDGCFYRFTPRRYPDLSSGTLEAAVVGAGGRVSWRRVPDPSTAETGTPTRNQAPGATRFKSGEGIWYARGAVYFTTKGDKKAWAYDIRRGRIEVLFDRAKAQDSSLDAVDNVTVSSAGDVFICEDGGNMEIGLITSDRTVSPFLRFDSAAHAVSEVCGVCFDPSGRRMYLTSQGAYPVVPGQRGPGAVYEVSGPFRLPRGGVPADFVYGPPAGEMRPNGPLNPGPDSSRPSVRVAVPKRARRKALVRRGLTIHVDPAEASTVSAVLSTADISRRKRGDGSPRRGVVRLSKVKAYVERPGGTKRTRLKLGRRARVRLSRRRKALSARVEISVRDGAGNQTIVSRRVRVGAAQGKRRYKPRRGRRRAK